MVTRVEPIRVISFSFILLAACAALCQNESSSVDLLQRDGSNSPAVQHQEARTWRSLADAPSTVQPPRQAEKFQLFGGEARLPLTFGGVGINAGVMREAEPPHLAPESQPSFAVFYKAGVTQKESSNFVAKYLHPPLLKQNLRYHPLTSGSFMSRATYAASRIFIMRDDSGKRRLNTSYFLGVLSSIAAHNASRPYWMRSNAAPFTDFGSTIGNDAGINLFHEFEPGIRQMVKNHTPRFAFKIEERITRDQNLKEVVSGPAR